MTSGTDANGDVEPQKGAFAAGVGAGGTLFARARLGLVLKLGRQSAGFENNDRFVVIFSQFRVSGAGKGDHADFCRRQAFRRPASGILRFARNGAIRLQTITFSGDVGLNNMNGFSGRGDTSEAMVVSPNGAHQLVLGPCTTYIQAATASPSDEAPA